MNVLFEIEWRTVQSDGTTKGLDLETPFSSCENFLTA